VVQGLVAGIFEGMDFVKERPEQAAQWMADAFGMKADEIMAMRTDAIRPISPKTSSFSSTNPIPPISSAPGATQAMSIASWAESARRFPLTR